MAFKIHTGSGGSEFIDRTTLVNFFSGYFSQALAKVDEQSLALDEWMNGPSDDRAGGGGSGLSVAALRGSDCGARPSRHREL